MNRLIRATTVLSVCAAGVLTPSVLAAPEPPEAHPEATLATPPSALPKLIGEPPSLHVYVKPVPTDDERLSLEPLEPMVTAQQREDHGHCGEFYDEAIAAGWQPSEWKRLRFVIARETGNTCDPGVLNDSAQTRDLSYGLTQINMRGRLGPDRLARCGLTAYEDLWDPKTNLACARVLYLLAGWVPWGFAPK